MISTEFVQGLAESHDISREATMFHRIYLEMSQSPDVRTQICDIVMPVPTDPNDLLEQEHPWNYGWLRGWASHNTYIQRHPNELYSGSERAFVTLGLAGMQVEDKIIAAGFQAADMIAPPLYRLHLMKMFPDVGYVNPLEFTLPSWSNRVQS